MAGLETLPLDKQVQCRRLTDLTLVHSKRIHFSFVL